MKKLRGISLIVLIVTIIVMIILATVITLQVTKNNPIEKAREVKFKDEVTSFKTELSLFVSNEYAELYGKRYKKINANNYIKPEEEGFGDNSIYKYIPSFKDEYNGKFLIIDDELIATSKLTDKEKEYIKDLKIKIMEIKTIDDLLADTKEDIDKYIGDFVNYDAGIWTNDEISSISARNSLTESPNNTFQFWGFAVGSNRNENATNAVAECIKDENGNEINGWRIFDISKDEVTLISAGFPERYYQWGNANYAYYSEYILTGNINQNATSLNIEDKYKKRNFDMYKNDKASYAGAFSKSILDNWYSKYFNIDNADVSDPDVSLKISGTKNKNLVAFDYSLCTAMASNAIYKFLENGKTGSSVTGGGVRVIVKLKKDVNFINTNETKNIKSGSNIYTYKVWDIK